METKKTLTKVKCYEKIAHGDRTNRIVGYFKSGMIAESLPSEGYGLDSVEETFVWQAEDDHIYRLEYLGEFADNVMEEKDVLVKKLKELLSDKDIESLKKFGTDILDEENTRK